MPLGDLRVRVWDRDWPDGDDLMAETFSGPDGHYDIRFQAGAWDSADGIFSLGRPDIYITAESQNDAAKWVRLGESRVHGNHDLRQDLRIDLSLALGVPISVRTDFIPEVHGFHFINSFPVSADLLGMDLGSWNMGFCGGMCSGALYRFLQGMTVPEGAVVPIEGSALHSELMRRQIKAMSPRMLPKMFEWQGSPDSSRLRRKQGIGERTREGWPDLRGALEEGKPTILVLIRVSGLLSNPTDNHQVLATGYDYDPLTMDLVVYVYDPNKPDRTQTVRLNLGLPEGRLDLVDSASPKTRGFFVNPVGEAAVEMEVDLG
jgi:hypothetical protein